MKAPRCLLLILAVILAACRPSLPKVGRPPSLLATPAVSSSEPTPTSEPARTPFPTATATLSPKQRTSLGATLEATLVATLTATHTDTLDPTATITSTGFSAFSGIADLRVISLASVELGMPLWAAFSLGMRSYEPLQNHFVVIYTYNEKGWQELGRVILENPDHIDHAAVKQVAIEPERVWLQVDSFAGAHSGCFDLLSFNGRSLRSELTNCASSPWAGELRDLDQDGSAEIILNWSEDYVFCYACGVRIASFQVWRWNGERLQEVRLEKSTSKMPAGLRRLNDEAVRLAKAELWKEAQAVIRKADNLKLEDSTFTWNAALIDLYADTRAEWAMESPYPVLGSLFYGDYDAILEQMRAYKPRELFNSQTPLVAGTVANGWESALKDWIFRFTAPALKVKPSLAAAYFLQGWATYLVDPSNREAYHLVLQAASAAPEDQFFKDCANYLQ